jgi:N-acetylmuramoyl-L-alanine amidase
MRKLPETEKRASMHSMGVGRAGFGLLLVLGVAMVAAACGGNGDDGAATGAPRLTDPATVPVADRVSGDMTYVIRDNGVSAPSGVTAPVTENGGGQQRSGQTYTVQSGDSCSAIAANLGVALDALMSANPQIDAECRNLQVGQELRVPGGASSGQQPAGNDEPQPTPAQGSGRTYEVQSGDLCIDIANSFAVDLDELVALNNLDCNNLQIGTVVRIP